ncbi:MAG: KEOPS complex subunit Pcc1 [Desulfurococcaceae archaeon]
MNISVEYRVHSSSKAVVNALCKSLMPDLGNLPEGCSGAVKPEEDSLALKLECTDISKLRALSNSFIGVLLLLLEIAGEFVNVGENLTTGGTAANNTVSDT